MLVRRTNINPGHVGLHQIIMTPTEKLQLIRAKCVELLEIASHRTPGEWITRNDGGASAVLTNEPNNTIARDAAATCYGLKNRQHAAFIAACAGPAEAGWRATIVAIDLCEQLPSPDASLILRDILTAWEGLI